VEQLDQLQTDLEENAGNWAKEVKPLGGERGKLGEGGEAVSASGQA